MLMTFRQNISNEFGVEFSCFMSILFIGIRMTLCAVMRVLSCSESTISYFEMVVKIGQLRLKTVGKGH